MLITGLVYAQTFDAIEVSVENESSVLMGETLSVEINTSYLSPDLDIGAFDFKLAFNTENEILSFSDYQTGDMLPAGIMGVNEADDVVSVGFITTSVVAGSGTLITLNFNVTGVGISDLIAYDFQYNDVSITNINNSDVTVTDVEDAVITVENDSPHTLGDTLFVDINTSSLHPDWEIGSFDFDFFYNTDGTVLDYIGYEEGNSLPSGTLLVNEETDMLNIAFMSLDNITQSGTLLRLKFVSTDTGASDLNVSDFRYNNVPINNINNSSVIIPDLSDVTITVENESEVTKGSTFVVDINTSSLSPIWELGSFEFQFSFNDPHEIITYDGYESGDILPAGNLLINQDGNTLSVGFISLETINGEGSLVRLHFTADETGNTDLEVSDFLYENIEITQIVNSNVTVPELTDAVISVNNPGSVARGEIFYVDINTTDISSDWEIGSFDFELDYNTNANIMNYVGYEDGIVLPAGQLIVNEQNNTLSVGFISLETISGEGDLVRLIFEATAVGNSNLDIYDFRYDNYDILNLNDSYISIGSYNAHLESIELDNEPLENFDRDTFAYDIVLDAGITEAPVVTATPEDPQASLVIDNPQTLPSTTTITVTSDDLSTTKVYTLDFTGTVVTPTFSPLPDLYTEATDVNIDTDTDGATIMYRTATDGGAWTDWETYTVPITVPLDTEMDFEAYAEKDGWVTSETAEAAYIVTGTVADPTFSPAPGLYTEATDVSIETDTEDATIMYRTATDGGAWTDWETYTVPITVPLDTEMDFEAYAEKDDWVTSETVSANYVVTGTVADPTFSPAPGLYTEATDVSIETDTDGATIMYRTLTDGGTWTDWQVFTTPITVPLDTEMDFEAYAEKDDWVTSETVSANYIVTGTVADPTFSPAPGLYTEATDVSIETDTEDATIMYRTATDGGAWTDWEVFTTPITVPLDTEMDFEAYAEKDDWVTSETVSANYIVTGTVADPTFSPAPGLYTEATDVSIETDTDGATIMYRTATDGGAWTDWQVFTTPITVPLDTEMDFEAYAEKDDWLTSQTVSANYIVTGTVADPTFSPAPGLYTEATDVSIETDTDGATIMYRTATDGGAWTDWQVFTTPITVPLDTEMDFEAYAEKDDWLTSQTVSANYVVTGAVADPTFSPAPGIYTEATDVTIETATEDATIMYRTATDGGAWSDWQVFTTPITVPLDTEMDFEAYAEKDDWVTSQTVSANYIVTGAVADPTFSPEPGLYTEATDVEIETDTEAATVLYRTSTDGGAWTDWQVFTTPITVPLDTEMDFEAYAEKDDWVTSQTVSANYIVTGTVADPTFSPEPGLYTEATDVEIETDTEAATVMYRTATDGGAWSDWETYTDPITVPLDTEMDFEAYAEKDDWVTSQTVSANYIITGTVADPTFSPEPGLYTEATDVSIETDTDGATIMYRTSTDGGPWSNWFTYTDPITVPLDTEMGFEAYAEKTDWITSATVEATYLVTGTVATPTFDPEGDVYLTAQTVTITTATAGATIEYSFDGEEWIEGDQVEITVSTMLYARAYMQDWVTSEIADDMYYILNPPQNPEAEGLAGFVHLSWDVPIGIDAASNIRINNANDRLGTNRQKRGDLVGYNIYRMIDGDFTLLNAEPILENEYEDQELEAGEYTYQVTAVYEQGESLPTDEVSTTVLKVAEPQFSKPSGTYTGQQSIEITTETEDAEIRYTTDGTDPTEESDLYTEPIVIGVNTTKNIKAKAFKADYISSDINTANYTVTQANLIVSVEVGDDHNLLHWHWDDPNVSADGGYNVYRQTQRNEFVKINPEPISHSRFMSYADTDVSNGVTYSYYVTAIFDGEETLRLNEYEVKVTYYDFEKAFIFPNPIRDGEATFRITMDAIDYDIQIAIYDFSGRLVRKLDNVPNTGYENVYEYTWNTRTDNGTKVARGSYFARIVAKNSEKTVEQIVKIAVIR
jgi:hypothetical protein